MSTGVRCVVGSRFLKGPFNFVNGRFISPNDVSKVFQNLQPATGDVLCEVPCTDTKSVNEVVQCANTAFKSWKSLTALERGSCLIRAADIVRKRHSEICEMEVLDTGKPLYEAQDDISAMADVLQYYGGIAPTLQGCHVPMASGNFALIHREPLGVVAGIGAWNYPFQVMTLKMAPALITGNTFIFKPSPLTPLTALMLAEICKEAGVPDGVVNVVQGEGETGEALCKHPDIAKITFTGSVPTGKRIMAMCSETMKKVTMELGGKSAMIIFPDADMENAVKATMLGNFLNQGEVCSNCTRVFVHRSIFKEFEEFLTRAASSMRIGDPFAEGTQVGACISAQHADKVLSYIRIAKEEGARILCGGERIKFEGKLGGGHYLSPCVITDCSDTMRVVREEIFGAVVCLLPFDEEEEVVARANSLPFGLAAGIMTKDLSRAHRVTSQLQAGTLYVNNYNVLPPEVPFGGTKMSGFGRELGLQSLESYTQWKSVIFDTTGKIDCPIYNLN